MTDTEKTAFLMDLESVAKQQYEALQKTEDMIKRLRFELYGDSSKTEILSVFENVGFIPAIKRLREVTGLGLKDAKEGVERLLTENGYVRHDPSYHWSKS